MDTSHKQRRSRSYQMITVDWTFTFTQMRFFSIEASGFIIKVSQTKPSLRIGGIIIHKHSTVGTLMWICGPRPRRDSFKMAKFSLTVVRILLADFIGALFYLFSFYLFLF